MAGEVGRLAASCKQACWGSMAVNILRKNGRQIFHGSEKEEVGRKKPQGISMNLWHFENIYTKTDTEILVCVCLHV